jgi:transcription-repair coupling factor (superfamily II helicase)
VSTPPLRGRRGRDRRIAERVATEFAQRHAPPDPDRVVDFDVAAVDAEVEDARRPPSAPSPGVTKAPAAPARKGGGHRLPDLSALPPLLAATGTFGALRERLGQAGDDSKRTGRHVGLVAIPHGAKSYLAAALALAANGERLVWIARDAEIGDRVAEELGAWLGDPEAVAVLEPRTSLAYERSELIADETAARVAALAAWRNGRARVLVASVQALLQHTIDPADLPDAPRELRVGTRIHQDQLLRELFDLGYVPVSEVAGRGESARRGGIVDVFPPSLSLPIRIEFFGDEIDSLRSFDPTDQRTVGAIDGAVLLPASEFLLPAGGASAIRNRLGRGASRLPERLAADLARFDTEPLDAGRAAAPDATRALAVGDAAEVWAAHLAPATGLDHIGPGTLLVLDEPGDIAEAAEFLWRQADERRAELVEAGELPKDWPSTYLPQRDWKGRLVGSRTLELTWESVPPEDVAMARGALSSGDPFGWREPVLPAGRAGRLVEAVGAWRADGARIVLASDQAPRLADILGEGGHPAAVVDRVTEAPPPGAVALIERSLNGGFIGGPDGLAFVTDRELFGTVRVRRPRALRRVVPRDILERLTAGDLVVHIDHGVARYEQMLRRGPRLP